MPKPRRKPPRVLLLPRLVVPVGLSGLLALSAAGFVHFTQITLYQQAHFAPEDAHPWDSYAGGCLFLGLIASAGLLLNTRDPAPTQWRKVRRTRFSGPARRGAKGRAASGTIRTP